MLSTSINDIGIADAGLVAVLGYGIVFAGLIALMVVVILIGKAFSRKAKEKKAVPAEPVVANPVEAVPAPVAPGTAGELKIYDVEPKTAAMLMAIVADKLQKPLNELRFISIREVK